MAARFVPMLSSFRASTWGIIPPNDRSSPETGVTPCLLFLLLKMRLF